MTKGGRAAGPRVLAPAFTLMEVLVAISVFSLAMSITFSLLTSATSAKQAGRGLLTGVFAVDDFLVERRLKGDAAEWFIPRERLALIAATGDEALRGPVGQELAYVLSNSGVGYVLRCRADVLTVRPLVFRGQVDCRWQVTERGKVRAHEYGAATVFAGGGARTKQEKRDAPEDAR